MKKNFIFLLCLFFSGVGFCYAEKSFYAGENVSDLHVINDYQGGAYVLYVENDNLKILNYQEKIGYIDLTDIFFEELKYSEIKDLYVTEMNGKSFFSFTCYIEKTQTYEVVYSYLNNQNIVISDFYFRTPLKDSKLITNWDNLNVNYCFINEGDLYYFQFENKKLIKLTNSKNIFKYDIVENNENVMGYYIEDNYCYLFNMHNCKNIIYSEIGIVDDDIKIYFFDKDNKYILMHYMSNSFVFENLNDRFVKIKEEKGINYYIADASEVKKVLSFDGDVMSFSDEDNILIDNLESVYPLYLFDNEFLVMCKFNKTWYLFDKYNNELKQISLNLQDDYSFEAMYLNNGYVYFVYQNDEFVKIYIIDKNYEIVSHCINNKGFNKFEFYNDCLLLSNNVFFNNVKFKDGTYEINYFKLFSFSNVVNKKYYECFIDENYNITINEVSNEL